MEGAKRIWGYILGSPPTLLADPQEYAGSIQDFAVRTSTLFRLILLIAISLRVILEQPSEQNLLGATPLVISIAATLIAITAYDFALKCKRIIEVVGLAIIEIICSSGAYYLTGRPTSGLFIFLVLPIVTCARTASSRLMMLALSASSVALLLVLYFQWVVFSPIDPNFGDKPYSLSRVILTVYLPRQFGLIAVSLPYLVVTQHVPQLLQIAQFHYELLKNLPMPAFAKNRKGQFVFTNDSFSAILGKKPITEGVLKSTDYDLFDRKLAKRFQDYDQQVMSSDKEFIIKNESIVDGHRVERDIRTYKSKLRNQSGVIIGVFGIFFDLNYSIRTIRSVDKARRELIRESRVCVFRCKASGVIEWADNSCYDTLDPRSVDALAKDYSEWLVGTPAADLFINPGDFSLILSKVESGQRVDNFRASMWRHASVDQWFIEAIIDAFDIPATNSEPRRIEVHFRDVSRRYADQIEIAMREEGDRLSFLESEFKHNVGRIISFGNKHLSSMGIDRNTWVSICNQIEDIVFLEFQGEKSENLPTASSVWRLVNRIWQNALIERQTFIELSMNVPDDFEIQVPRSVLIRAVGNLISNSIRGIERRREMGGFGSGGLVLSFRIVPDIVPKQFRSKVSSKRNLQFCEIQVLDNGCGIPDPTSLRGFSTKTTTTWGGKGLGLYLVRERLGQFGGQLRFVESTPNVETKFCLIVPCKMRNSKYENTIH